MFKNNDHNDILLIYFLQTKNAPLSSQTDIQFEVVRNYGQPLILQRFSARQDFATLPNWYHLPFLLAFLAKIVQVVFCHLLHKSFKKSGKKWDQTCLTWPSPTPWKLHFLAKYFLLNESLSLEFWDQLIFPTKNLKNVWKSDRAILFPQGQLLFHTFNF